MNCHKLMYLAALTGVLIGCATKKYVRNTTGSFGPIVTVNAPAPGSHLDGRRITLSLHLELPQARPAQKEKDIAITDIIVSVNDHKVFEHDASNERAVLPENTEVPASAVQSHNGGKSFDVNLPVLLEPGLNLIEIRATATHMGTGYSTIRYYTPFEASPAELAALKAEPFNRNSLLPRLWILAIGINHYDSSRITPLAYAVDDAEAIAKVFQLQRGRLFRGISSRLLTDRSELKPTYENIIDNLDYLARASQNDFVLLFISGHGVNDQRGEYYLLPSDAVILEDGSLKQSRAISWRQLRTILELPAKKLVLLDTCHSAGFSGARIRGVDSNKLIEELRSFGALVFSSSRAQELSQESPEWRHGAFTYALIEGLSGKADLLKDNIIYMKELDTYVSQTVPTITRGAQHPITFTPEGYENFPVAVLH